MAGTTLFVDRLPVCQTADPGGHDGRASKPYPPYRLTGRWMRAPNVLLWHRPASRLRMAMRLPGIGSQYLLGDHWMQTSKYLRRRQDLQGDAAQGHSGSQFLVVYRSTTIKTRSMLDTPQRYPRAGIQNFPSPAAEADPTKRRPSIWVRCSLTVSNRGNWISDDARQGLVHDPQTLQSA